MVTLIGGYENAQFCNLPAAISRIVLRFEVAGSRCLLRLSVLIKVDGHDLIQLLVVGAGKFIQHFEEVALIRIGKGMTLDIFADDAVEFVAADGVTDVKKRILTDLIDRQEQSSGKNTRITCIFLKVGYFITDPSFFHKNR